MINVIVAYDDIDDEIGEFFLQCYYDLLQYFNSSENNIQWIGGDKLNQNNIQEIVSDFEGKPFICLAYSHGTEDALQCVIDDYKKAYVMANISELIG